MYFLHERFKDSKKSNDKWWKIVEYLLLSGYDFLNLVCGSKRYIYFELPKNLDEVKAFASKMRNLD